MDSNKILSLVNAKQDESNRKPQHESVDTFFLLLEFLEKSRFSFKNIQTRLPFLRRTRIRNPFPFLTEINHVHSSIPLRSRYARPVCRMPQQSARSPIQTRHLSSRQHPTRHHTTRTPRQRLHARRNRTWDKTTLQKTRDLPQSRRTVKLSVARYF